MAQEKAPAAAVAASAASADKVAARKKKGALGDKLFVAYNLAFAGAVAAGYYGLIPALPVEKASLAHSRDWAAWMGQNFWIPVALSVLYVVAVFGGQYLMKDRAPFDLRNALALWSLLLSVFSFWGAVRTVPRVIEIISHKGVEHLVCGDTRYEWLVDDPAGFATFVFCLSKVPELVDTFFLVVHKKPVITLHWFHHFTVMLFCWTSWATCTLNGIIFSSMNLSVHTTMYFYYFLAALGYTPRSFSQSITTGQIIQMVVGTAVTGYVVMDKVMWHPVQKIDFGLSMPDWIMSPKPRVGDLPCHVSSGNALSGLLMYTSYLILFVHFFYEAYLKPNGKLKEA